ncbi:MAG: signal peptidase [Pseudooceanicola sp.]|jgi:predicted lipoprotein|nr:signal peptidase [Pseudooceanicola sp.]
MSSPVPSVPRLIIAPLLALAFTAPAHADVADVVDSHILPALADFADATAQLDSAAQADCTAKALRPAYQTAFDAWGPLADLRIGPSENGVLSVVFWPDARGFTPKALRQMLSSDDADMLTPEAFSDASIAVRGLMALDMMLYDPAFADYGAQDRACALVQTISADLARQAVALDTDWQAFAPKLRNPGGDGNAQFQDDSEAVRAVYTQITASLEFTADTRLGGPLGTFDRPRPRRAEAWRSHRSLPNVLNVARAAHAMAQALADHPLPGTDEALEAVERAGAHISDPGFKDITNPQARLKVEVLQQAVRALKLAITTEVGAELGISAGFNAQDGD